ncbi:MAG: hypothetical protein FWF50_00795, partial [Defluviitaleaceae bacterium]|nr:hypothetical protein [Defluviitaleaceae bacterium]
LVIGFAVSILVFNAFNIRENFLRGVLENVPGLNTLLDDTGNGVTAPATQAQLGEAITAYRNEIERLQLELAQTTANLTTTSTENNALNERIQSLEEELSALIPLRDGVLENISESYPETFITLFEAFDPDRAAEVYGELIQQAQASAELQNYLNIFETMRARDAAASLSAMIEQGQFYLVVSIIDGLSLSTQASVLSALETDERGSILIQLNPS